MHKTSTTLTLAALGLAVGLAAAAADPAVAGTRDPCQVLPVGTVQSILGSPVLSHALPPATSYGQTVTQCLYLGPHQASLQLTDAGTSAAAAAYVAMRPKRGGMLVDHKGSYVLIVAVAKPNDYGKLGALRSVALKNL